MELKMSFLIPVFIAKFLNIVPIQEPVKLPDDPWNLKEAKLVKSLLEEDINLYALNAKAYEKSSAYKEILLIAKRDVRYYPCLIVDKNYGCRLELNDLDSDGKKELILITSPGGGAGSHEETIYVYRITPSNYLYDIYVMDPFEGMYQNVKSEMTKENGIVTININVGGKVFTLKEKESILDWGDEVYFGAAWYYNVADNKLNVDMNVTVGNNVLVGKLKMDYVYENKRLKINNVTFEKDRFDWIHQ